MGAPLFVVRRWILAVMAHSLHMHIKPKRELCTAVDFAGFPSHASVRHFSLPPPLAAAHIFFASFFHSTLGIDLPCRSPMDGWAVFCLFFF